MRKYKCCLIFFFIVISVSCTRKSKEKTSEEKLEKNENFEHKKQNDVFVNQLIRANDLNPDLKIQAKEQWMSYKDYRLDITALADENCTSTYLSVKKGAEIENVIEIKKDCDSDLSFYKYEWFDYKLVSDTIFIIKVREEVLDTSILDVKGFIKNGIERSEQPSLRIDTSYFCTTRSELLMLKVSWPKVILAEKIMRLTKIKVDID